MNLKELNKLVPKNKLDTKKAEKLVALGYPKVKPVLDLMVFWSLEANDPVAHVFMPFLQTLNEELIPSIANLLSDKHLDLRSKSIILTDLVEPRGKAFAKGLAKELKDMADRWGGNLMTFHPVPNTSYVGIYALSILAKNKLADPKWLLEKLSEKESEIRYKTKLLKEIGENIKD